MRRNGKTHEPAVFGRRRDRQLARGDGKRADRRIQEFGIGRRFRQLAIGYTAAQIMLVGGDQEFGVGERASERDKIGNEPARVLLLRIVGIGRRSPRQLQSHLPLRGEILGQRRPMQIVSFDAARRLLEPAHSVEIRRALRDGARRFPFRPEIAEQVVRQHGAEAMGDNDEFADNGLDAARAAVRARVRGPRHAPRYCRARPACSGPPARR